MLQCYEIDGQKPYKMEIELADLCNFNGKSVAPSHSRIEEMAYLIHYDGFRHFSLVTRYTPSRTRFANNNEDSFFSSVIADLNVNISFSQQFTGKM